MATLDPYEGILWELMLSKKLVADEQSAYWNYNMQTKSTILFWVRNHQSNA